MSQLDTTSLRSRSTRAVFCAGALVTCLAACSPEAPAPEDASPETPSPEAPSTPAGEELGVSGGRLVVASTSDPRTFNPMVAVSGATLTILDLMHEDLTTFDPVSQEVVPSLAESWTALSVDPSGAVAYRMILRPDLRFSDGEPLDADDVLFTVHTLLDPEVGSPQRETLLVDGEPITVTKVDARTVDVVLPSPTARPSLIFDRLYVLPEHRLGNAPEPADAWGTETDPAELVGLGPFRAVEYLPGERLVLERNPHFWKKDAAGTSLPYLDQLVVTIVPDKQAALLRFEAGEIDLLDGIPVDAFEQLRAGAPASSRVRDLGAGTAYEFLFFNLNPPSADADPGTERKRRWFADPLFRRAISRAVDRRGIAELVYRGRATPIATHVSPGNRRWVHPELEPPETSLDEAGRLLSEAGFRRGDDGRWTDADGEAVAFTLLTNSSTARRVQTATVVQEDLARLGLDVQMVALDFGALLQRVTGTFDYDLVLLGLGSGIDPKSDLNVWHSSGSSHLWHLGSDCPAYPWEARMDDLLVRQSSELDPEKRLALYHEVQSLVAEHLPVIPLVAPNVLVAAGPEVGNFAPTIFEPTTLWNVERLYRRSGGR